MLHKTDKYFWIANLLIVLSLILFFSRSLFTNRVLASGDFETYPFFISDNSAGINFELPLLDPINFVIPMLHFDRQILKNGKIPLWNPYQGCGVPHIANMQSAFFYPLNIFVYLLNWKWGLFFLFFFKLYFVGLFFYLYLREIKISPPVSMVFSVSGMYMGFNLSPLYFPFTNVAFFFPLALWTIELILKKPKQFKGYFIFCLGFVATIFGGHPELVFYSMFTLVIYLLGRLYLTYRLDLYDGYLPVLIKFFIALIIGIMISSIQLLPFLEYFRLSSAYLSRNTLELTIHSLPVYLLVFNILPTLTPRNMLLLLNYVFNKYQTILTLTYTGVSILLLGITGVIALSKDKIVRIFIIISIITLCTGFYVPYVHAIITKIPGFDIGRNYYMLIFACWALLIISSKALDNFIKGNIKLRSFDISAILILMLIIVLGFFFIRGDYPSMSNSVQKAVSYYLTFSTAAAIIIMVFTLWILKIKNRQFLLILMGILIYAQTALPMIFIEPAIKPAYFYPINSIFTMLQKKKGQPFRVTALISNTLPIAYAANINTFYRIEDIRNYDALGVNWYNSIFSYIKESDSLNLTNVKYLIVRNEFDLSNLTNVFQPVAEYNGYTLYKNLSAFNRAFMVYHYIIADGQQQALDLLSTYSGQLNTTAIIFKKDIQAMPFTPDTQGTYKIAFVKYASGYIKMSCNTSQPGLFFISDTYFPGWHARVDGKETKIIRTDYAFQGLWLSKGNHIIELNYDPASFKYGTLLSIIGILSLIGFYFIAFRKKKLMHKV